MKYNLFQHIVCQIVYIKENINWKICKHQKFKVNFIKILRFLKN